MGGKSRCAGSPEKEDDTAARMATGDGSARPVFAVRAQGAEGKEALRTLPGEGARGVAPPAGMQGAISMREPEVGKKKGMSQ